MNFVTSVFKKYMNKNENKTQKESVPIDKDNVPNNQEKKTKEGSSESSMSEKINPIQHKSKDEDFFYDAKIDQASSALTVNVNSSSSQSIVSHDCAEYNGPPKIIEENADDFPDSLNNSINDSIDSETNQNFTESDYNIYDSIEVTLYTNTASVINVNKLEDYKSLESIGADSLEDLSSELPKIIDNHDINGTNNEDIGGNSRKDTKSDNNHKLVSLNDILFEPHHSAVKDCYSFKGNVQHIEAAQNFPSHVPMEQEITNTKNKKSMINNDEENKATINMIPKIKTDNQKMLEIRVPETFQENIHQKEVVSVVHEPTKKSIESNKCKKVLPNLLEDQLLFSTLTQNCNESNLDDSQGDRKLSIMKPENEDIILLTKVLEVREKTDTYMAQLNTTQHKPSTVQEIDEKNSNDLSFVKLTEVKENLIHIAEGSHEQNQPFFDNNEHEWQDPREVQKLSDNECKSNATQADNIVHNVETNKTQVCGNLGIAKPENISEKSSNNTESSKESTSNLTLSENKTALENGTQMITVDAEMTSEYRIIGNNINSENIKEGNECPNGNISKVNKDIEQEKCIQKSDNTEDLEIDRICDNNIEFQKSPVSPNTEHMVTMNFDSEPGQTNSTFSDKTDNITAIEDKPDNDVLPSKLEVRTDVNQPVEEGKENILQMQNDTMTGTDKDKQDITIGVSDDNQSHNNATEKVTEKIIMNSPESTMEDVNRNAFSDEDEESIEKLETNSEEYIQTYDNITEQCDAVIYDSIEDIRCSNQNRNINIGLINQADNLGNMKTKENVVPIPEESNGETQPFLDNDQYKWNSTSEFEDLRNKSLESEEIDITSSNKNENLKLINHPDNLGNMKIEQHSIHIPEESHKGTKLVLDNDEYNWQHTNKFEESGNKSFESGETRKYDTVCAIKTNQAQNIKGKLSDSKPEKIPENTNHDETTNQLLRDHSSSNELGTKNPGINGAKGNDIIGESVDKKNETIKGNKSFESGETRKYDTAYAIETSQTQNIKNKLSDGKPGKIPENANHDETPNQLLRDHSSSNELGMKNLGINGAKGNDIIGECVDKKNETIELNKLSHLPKEITEKILNSKQGIIGDVPLISLCAEPAKEMRMSGTNDEEYSKTGDDFIQQSKEIELDSIEKITKFSEKQNMTQLETCENPITVEQINQEYSVKKYPCEDCDKEKTTEMNEKFGTKYPIERFDNLEQECSRVNDAERNILFNSETHQSGIKTEIHELGSDISTDKMPESSIFSPDFNRQDTREFENLEKQCQEAVTSDDILNAILGANRNDKDTENRNVLKNAANKPIADSKSDLGRREKNIFESTEFKASETCPVGPIFLKQGTYKNNFQEEQCGTDSLEQLDGDIKSECDLNQKEIESPRNITDTLYVTVRNNEEEISSESFRLHENDTNLSRNISQTSETDQGCIKINVVGNYDQSNIVDQKTIDLAIAKSSGSSQNRVVKNELDKILVNETSKVIYPEELNELSDSIRGGLEYDQKVVRSNTIDLKHGTKLSKSVSGDNIEPRPVSREGRSSKFGDVHEELKNKVDLLQQELSSIMRTKRKSQVDTDKDTERNVIVKYKNLLNEYEKRIGQQATDLEQLKMEAEQNVRHFTTTEMAFSDLFEKYEKAKYAITVYRRNEDVLLENIQNAEDQLSIIEAKCRSMQQQSMQQIQWARGQVEKEKKAYDKELGKLQSQVKRLEIKASSLERALKQKCDECQALSSLCDDITGLNSTPL